MWELREDDAASIGNDGGQVILQKKVTALGVLFGIAGYAIDGKGLADLEEGAMGWGRYRNIDIFRDCRGTKRTL